MKNIGEGPYYLAQGGEVALFEHAARHCLPVLVKGPTGCGKTRFIQYMAHRLSRELYTVACHDDLTAADLVGRHLISGDGTFWQDGPLTRSVREGAICYLDEVIEARKDTTVVLHPLADDRRILPLERTGEMLEAGENFMLVVSYNPGYQNILKGMKPSTRQRFVGISLDYPAPDIEAQVVETEGQVDKLLARRIVDLGQALRRLEQHDLEEAASTRLLIYAARLISSGLDPMQACQACMVEPLTDDVKTADALRQIIDIHFGHT
ncbi:CbbQ/NirQ/NorQ/GpvN family protein [Hahella ganghwensis]|uniref:CbbQ/NirQ/NorQ/GpvN family protein n=1 Tax=Hahella ganghwensis TaxID=286420 RepID=UPI0003632F80|nr:CbbQ/NirQ/NorQ/GpvN family protein [Hahella ganghwensis]